MNTYSIHLDRRFDPCSSGLSVSLANGQCHGEFIPPGTWVVLDSSIKPQPFDLVGVAVQRRGQTFHVTKAICGIAGRVWLLSEEPPVEYDPQTMRIEGTLVARIVPPPKCRIVVPTDEAPPEFHRELLLRARPVLDAIAWAA